MKLIFCLQINTDIFYKLIVSVRVCVARHAQSTQNNKFAISVQYLRENEKAEVGFFLLLDNMIFMGMVKHSQSSQNSKFAMSLSLQYLKKEFRNEVDFLHAGKHQSFLHVDFNTWKSKFPTR